MEQPYSYSTIALFFGLATSLALLMAHAVRCGPSWQLLRQPKTHGLRGRFHIEMEEFSSREPIADAVVVCSGVAGLSTALTLLERGGTVTIIEKEPIL
jgi:NADPH-dependent 2,4-dienoyl-CoA reductase/sulfur reductase-like enzyme